jgi:hypothetical protein
VLPNAETISNLVRWEQNEHKSTTQELHGIGNITALLTRLKENTKEHRANKAAKREYRI